MMTEDLLGKVFAFTQENGLFSAPCRLVLGASGGADSITLLRLLCSWPQKGLELTAVHVHHGLRGEAADRDAAFVAAQCEQLGVPCQVVYADVSALASSLGCGIEEAGRLERYRIFEQVRLALQADYILTAHNADDQTETVLLHILRGCGTDGLRGIPAAREVIRRPLLCCTRQEIEEFCRNNGVSYVTDETNTDTAYTRNRVRCEVLPLLRQINPSVDAAIRRLSLHSGEDSAFLYELAKDALNQARLPDGGYAAAFFCHQPKPVRRRMILTVLEEWGLHDICEKYILGIEDCLLRGQGGIMLASGLQAAVSQGRLMTVPSEQDLPKPIAIDRFPFDFLWNGQAVSLRLFSNSENVHKLFLQNAIDYDRIQGGLCVRCRQEGDRIHPIGRGIGKTLKKLMNEWKIPACNRNTMPLLCDEAGVLLVPGMTCDERVRVTDNTKHFLVWHCDGEQG